MIGTQQSAVKSKGLELIIRESQCHIAGTGIDLVMQNSSGKAHVVHDNFQNSSQFVRQDIRWHLFLSPKSRFVAKPASSFVPKSTRRLCRKPGLLSELAVSIWPDHEVRETLGGVDVCTIMEP
jgi:hypothetical protein